MTTSTSTKSSKPPYPPLLSSRLPIRSLKFGDQTSCHRRDTFECRIGLNPRAVATPSHRILLIPTSKIGGVHMTSSSSLRRIFGWRNMGLLHSSTLSLFIPHTHRCCFSSGLIDIHGMQVEGGGSRTVYHHAEVTTRYTKDFCFRNQLLKSASFCWLRR
jgi:hypothetical protein